MLPQDPMILLSMVNMKLRDGCDGLEDLCADLDLERAELEERLGAVGFAYDSSTNQFR